MAEKLRGMLILDKIDKEQIFETKSGHKAVWVDIIPNRDGADQYGNTHAITTWSKDKGTTYLGNLRPEQFGGGQAAPAPQPSIKEQVMAKSAEQSLIPQPDDLPF